MKRKSKTCGIDTMLVVIGMVVGWNLQFVVKPSQWTRAIYDSKSAEDSELSHLQRDSEPVAFDDTVMIGVMTSRQYLTTRAAAVYSTWGSDVTGRLLFYVGQEGNTSLDVSNRIRPNRTEETPGTEPIKIIHNLPVVELNDVSDTLYPPRQKCYAMLRHMSHNFGSQFRWFIRADDDVYIRYKNLTHFLRSVDDSMLWYMGKPGYGLDEERGHLGLLHDQPYCVGGTGVIFSSSSLRLLIPHLHHCHTTAVTSHEDTELGRCVQLHLNLSCTNGDLVHSLMRPYLSKRDHKLPLAESLLSSVTFHPVKEPQFMWTLHHGFRLRQLQNLQQHLQSLEEEVKEMETLIRGQNVLTVNGGLQSLQMGRIITEDASHILEKERWHLVAPETERWTLRNVEEVTVWGYGDADPKKVLLPGFRGYSQLVRNAINHLYKSPQYKAMVHKYRHAVSLGNQKISSTKSTQQAVDENKRLPARHLREDSNEKKLLAARYSHEEFHEKTVLPVKYSHKDSSESKILPGKYHHENSYNKKILSAKYSQEDSYRNRVTQNKNENRMTPIRSGSKLPSEEVGTQNKNVRTVPSKHKTRRKLIVAKYQKYSVSDGLQHMVVMSDGEGFQTFWLKTRLEELEWRELFHHDLSTDDEQTIFLQEQSERKYNSLLESRTDSASERYKKASVTSFSQTTTSSWPTLQVLLPVSGSHKVSPWFMGNVSKAAEGYAGQIHLHIVLCQTTKEQYQAILGASERNTDLNVTMIRLSFAFSCVVGLNTLAKTFEGNSILIFIDADLIMTERFFYRAALATQPGTAYMPVVFSKYSPQAVCYGRPQCVPDVFDFTQDSGTWWELSDSVMAIVAEDFTKCGGLNGEGVGWRQKDSDIMKRCLSKGINVFRAADVGLVHDYHDRCDPQLSADQLATCYRSKRDLYGSVETLSRMILDAEDMLKP